MPVTSGEFSASPKPTVARPIDLVPKAVFGRCVSSVEFCPGTRQGKRMIGDDGWIRIVKSVTNIFGLCTEYQMCRVAAGTKMASMTNNHAFRDRTIMDLVGDAVGKIYLTLHVETPVPRWLKARSEPLPTLARSALVNLLPKAFQFFRGILMMHKKLAFLLPCRERS